MTTDSSSRAEDGIADGHPCDHPAARQDMRCSCGSLLARLVSGGVELKCRRCKRTMVLPLEENGSLEVRISGG